jgi:hypothetical protein
MKKLIVSVGFSLLLASVTVLAAEPSPTPAPQGGKNVKTKVEQPKRSKPVGVQAQDPTQNGRVNTSGALSPMNANSMGAGIQFDITPPKKIGPKKSSKKNAEENE